MAGVDDDAETFVGGDADGETDEEEGRAEKAPPAAGGREDEDESEKDAADNVGDAGVADEEHARLVAVADAPTDEVGVGLTAQGALHDVAYEGEGGWVRGVLQSVEDGGAGLVGEIELARGVGSEIMGNYAVDFGAVRLDGDWRSCVG